MRALFAIFTFSLLLLSACSHGGGGSGALGQPDFADSTWLSNYHQVLSFQYQPSSEYSGGYLYANLFVKNPEDSLLYPSVKINNHELDLSDTEFNEEDGGTWYEFDWDLERFSPDSTFSYELNISGVNYHGAMKFPSSFQMTYPTYVPNNDYTFHWLLQRIPDIQMLVIEMYYPEDDPIPETEEAISLNKSKRSYTITKEKIANALDAWTALLAFKIDLNSSSLLTYSYTIAMNAVDFTDGSFKHHFKHIEKSITRNLVKTMNQHPIDK